MEISGEGEMAVGFEQSGRWCVREQSCFLLTWSGRVMKTGRDSGSVSSWHCMGAGRGRRRSVRSCYGLNCVPTTKFIW